MAEQGDKKPEISEADYNKAVERAQRFEGQLADLQKKFDKFKNIDPEKYHAALEELDNFKRDKATGNREEIDQLITNKEREVRAALQKDIDAIAGERDKTKNELKELKVTDKVFGLTAADINGDCVDDVKRYIREYCDVDEDGNIFARDPKTKEKMYVKGSAAKVLDGAGFVEWLKESRPSWFKATANGGGMGGGESRSSGSSSNKRYTLADLQKISPAELDRILAKDPNAIKNAIEGL